MLLQIRYTPVCGTGVDDPVCGLLEFDGCRLLLDCGWTEGCNSSHVEAIAGVLPSVDAILLSHGDMAHIGALPALCAVGTLPPDLPIISTLPVKVMGCLMLQEFLADKKACSDQLPFSMNHIDQVFDGQQWALLRFYQRLTLTGRAEGIQVTPLAAGHTLGGAVWRLVSHDGQEVVYAVDWCHRKERHLAACLLPELFVRPAALITDARAALHPYVDSSRRDAEFMDLLLSTLRGTDGCVLIPVQTTARMLELALLLDEFWTKEKFSRVYPLVLVSAVGKAVLEAAQSQLEWMSDSVTKAFERKRENPLNFKCLKVLSNVSQLTQLQAGPKVVLAGGHSCEQGPARQLLLDWAAQEQHTICFVQRPQEGSIAYTLLRHVPTADGPPLTLNLTQFKRVRLEGAELEAWLAEQSKVEEEEEEGHVDHVMTPVATRVSSAPVLPVTHSGRLDRSHSGASVVPGLTPLRANSTHLSSLVRDASGNLVQQLLPSSSLPPLTPLQVGPGNQLATIAASDLGPGAPAATGRAAVLMDGFEAPQGALFPMFPDEDQDAGLTDTWDEYGRLPDLDAFKAAAAAMSSVGITSQQLQGVKRAGRAPGIKMEMDGDGDEESKEDLEEIMTRRRVRVKMEVGEASSDDDDGDDDEEEGKAAVKRDQPTKLVEEQVEVTVRAAIRYFNYDGLADARIVRKAVSEIAPQSLIVLQGSDVARQDLHAHVSRELQGFGTRVMLPGAGEQVDASVPACHLVMLSDVLQSECIPHQLGRSGDVGVVIDTVLCTVPAASQELGAPLQLLPCRSGGVRQQEGSEGGQGDGRLASADSGQLSGGQSGGQQSWLGDVFFADGSEGVRLSEIKKALADAGIQSTWLGPGAISCGSVIISKISMYNAGRALSGEEAAQADARAGKGHVVLEGAVTEQQDDLLQRVRAVIYTQFGARG